MFSCKGHLPCQLVVLPDEARSYDAKQIEKNYFLKPPSSLKKIDQSQHEQHDDNDHGPEAIG